MSNLAGLLYLFLILALVLGLYGGIFWLHRIANRRRLRDGEDAIAAVHASDVPDVRYCHGEPTHTVDSSFQEGGGEFGGGGASESYDSGGGDSGDGGGDGGGGGD